MVINSTNIDKTNNQHSS